MARSKGSPKPLGSGRKPGTPNKRTRVLAACEKKGIDPFEYLASVVADRGAETSERIACAKELCEYLEPKLSRQEYESGQEGDTTRGYLLIPVRPK